MSNLVALALVVVSFAILVLFSREFGDLGKKIFALPGVKLVLPLLIASFIIAKFDLWIYFILVKIRHGLLFTIEGVASFLPWDWSAYAIASILVLISFSFLPVLALQFWFNKKSYLKFQHSYLVNTVLWLFLVILWLTQGEI